MPGLDFSETKRQFALVKSVLSHGGTEEERKAALGAFEGLVAKLDFKQTVMWSIFATVSVASTLMILWFIDSFNVEQEKYQTVLTSVGRNRAEYNDLNGIVATTTNKEHKVVK